ncbi:MAG: signal peptidase I [Acidiferrobacterales bacterium]|nr:signal peptidase I [Acidiferrobacterales bacterium]
MDFSLILFICLVVTGIISLIYRLFFEGQAATSSEPAGLGAPAQTHPTGQSNQPILVEYARALFPVILIVFVLRSFIVEPFRIPSGSMLPSLHIGDFILVNKFSYGIRLPVLHKKVASLGDPERGDVMVFRFPRDPKLNYIKRVIGIPGDTLTYRNKQLFINGEEANLEADGEFAYQQIEMRGRTARQLQETFEEGTHSILIDDSNPAIDMQVTVPEGQYFVMGDNRDHSNDSRYWRFVPEENIVGKAFFIWFSWKSATGGGVNWGRIGETIR